MRWKPLYDQYEVSTAGLVRRRVHAAGNPVGLLLSPSINEYGSVRYCIRNEKKKLSFRTVHMLLDEKFNKEFKPTAKWCEIIREYVNRYNGYTFGISTKQTSGDELPVFWDYKKYQCPWDTFDVDTTGHYTMADLCPVI